MYAIGQLIAGTGAAFSVLSATAIVLGLFAVRAGGGVKSFIGMLNFQILLKFLLVCLAVKVLSLSPADGTLRQPVITGSVMALGFGALWLATMVQSRITAFRSPIANSGSGPDSILSLSIAFFLVGYGGYAVSMAADFGGRAAETGGILGYARTLSTVKALAIVPALYYAWITGSKKFLSHPFVLTLLLIEVTVGLFSTSKHGALEPLVAAGMVWVARLGFRNYRVLGGVIGLIVYYALIVYPYSQYVRHNGGRDGGLSDRSEVMVDVLGQLLSGGDLAAATELDAGQDVGYFQGGGTLEKLNRFSLVGDADRLIAATYDMQAYTGWTTVVWGFQLMMPSALFPNKPSANSGNFLAHVAGDLGEGDMSTNVSYGVMANFYHAFGLIGGGAAMLVFFGLSHYILRSTFPKAFWTRAPSSRTMWFIIAINHFHHPFAEESISGLIPSVIIYPLVFILIVLVARPIRDLLPRRGGRLQPFSAQRA